MASKLIIATLLTGIISGFFITFYSLLITFFTYLFFQGNPLNTIPNLPIWYLYLVPITAIFLVNYLISKDKHIQEYGVSEIADSITQNKITFKIKTLFWKIIASTLSLSSGFSVGTEGPSAGIGAMIAYHIHKIFKLPTILIKMMISVGASAGIAAIFVSPLTGVAFAVENIAYQFLKKYIGYLILASFIAFLVTISFLEPIIFLHSKGKAFVLSHLVGYILFLPYITFFIYFYLFLKRKVLSFIDFKIIRNLSQKYRRYIFAFVGGVIVGTILTIAPQASFSGHELVLNLINSQKKIELSVIFLILILRIINTTISIYSNAIGGIFLPLMSIGALTGYSYAELLISYTSLDIEPFYFAAIGASVFMGVIMKLPLTAVVLALETTFDYNVVVATGIIVVFVEYFSLLAFDIKRGDVLKKLKDKKS